MRGSDKTCSIFLYKQILKSQLATGIAMSNDLKAEFGEFVRESENTSRVFTLWMDILTNQVAIEITLSNDLKAEFGEFVGECENASCVLLCHRHSQKSARYWNHAK